MLSQDRHARIVEMVDRSGSVSVETLAASLSASRETIRRDLAALDSQGLLRKVHGGARRIAPIPVETGFDARMARNVAEKRRIARRAAALFRPGDSLFMDAGSTTIHFAEHLARLSGLTVITNCIGAVRHLAGPGTRLFLLGGEYQEAGQETLGPITESDLRRFRADHVVLTVGAVQEGAIMDYDLREASLARAMLAQAREVTVLADHDKFDRPAVFEVAPLSRISRLVTDRSPPPQLEAALLAAGVQVIIA